MYASFLPFLRSASNILLSVAFFLILTERSAFAQETGAVPNGGFEDSTAFGQHWDLTYGKRALEDSIALKGGYSLKLEEVEDHIDMVSDPLGSVNRGGYELSFWYRGYEGAEEWAPLWVEVLQDGEAIKVFRVGKEKARMRKLSRDWLLFNGPFKIESGSPVRIYIHSDLPRLWIDDISLVRDDDGI